MGGLACILLALFQVERKYRPQRNLYDIPILSPMAIALQLLAAPHPVHQHVHVSSIPMPPFIFSIPRMQEVGLGEASDALNKKEQERYCMISCSTAPLLTQKCMHMHLARSLSFWRNFIDNGYFKKRTHAHYKTRITSSDWSHLPAV